MKSAEWIKENFKSHRNIKSIRVISDDYIEIEDDKGISLTVGVLSLKRINIDIIHLLKVDLNNADFVVNIRTEPYIAGAVYSYLETKRVPIGDLGDLSRVLAAGTAEDYLNPEVKFITKGLSQHTKVESIVRLNNRTYRINRRGMEPVDIVAINDYEFTAESVRKAKDFLEDLDGVVLSNPNARVSNEATLTAQSLNIPILKWRELLGKLNNRIWN